MFCQVGLLTVKSLYTGQYHWEWNEDCFAWTLSTDCTDTLWISETSSFFQNGRITIRVLQNDGDCEIGQRSGFSKTDLEKLRKMYKVDVKRRKSPILLIYLNLINPGAWHNFATPKILSSATPDFMSPRLRWKPKKDVVRTYIPGDSADIVRKYISRDIYPHYILLRFSAILCILLLD